MNSSIKAPYSSPSAKVLEVKTENFICTSEQSGTTGTENYDTEDKQEW